MLHGEKNLDTTHCLMKMLLVFHFLVKCTLILNINIFGLLLTIPSTQDPQRLQESPFCTDFRSAEDIAFTMPNFSTNVYMSI